VNCAGLPETLLESELFGHVKGSFTGAYRDKPGKLETAHMGTVFLDEVGEMTLRMQGLLLRFLETGELQKVGADGGSRHVDVRVVAATNRNLRDMIAQSLFRDDLYYRLNVIHIVVPPLRDRREDIPALAHHFLDVSARKMGRNLRGFTNAAMDRLVAHTWRGNVRELENEIERLVVLAGDATTIGGDLLSLRIRQYAPDDDQPVIDPSSLPAAVEALERRMIGAAMRKYGGNKTRAAEDLKVSRRNLIRLVQKYQLEK